eukprot:234866_1
MARSVSWSKNNDIINTTHKQQEMNSISPSVPVMARSVSWSKNNDIINTTHKQQEMNSISPSVPVMARSVSWTQSITKRGHCRGEYRIDNKAERLDWEVGIKC